jgi:hypothetical protein
MGCHAPLRLLPTEHVPWVAARIPRPALLLAAVALPMGEVTEMLVVERGDTRKDQCNSVVELVVRKP